MSRRNRGRLIPIGGLGREDRLNNHDLYRGGGAGWGPSRTSEGGLGRNASRPRRDIEEPEEGCERKGRAECTELILILPNQGVEKSSATMRKTAAAFRTLKVGRESCFTAGPAHIKVTTKTRADAVQGGREQGGRLRRGVIVRGERSQFRACCSPKVREVLLKPDIHPPASAGTNRLLGGHRWEKKRNRLGRRQYALGPSGRGIPAYVPAGKVRVVPRPAGALGVYQNFGEWGRGGAD